MEMMNEMKPIFVKNLLMLYSQGKLPSIKKVLQESFDSNETSLLEKILESYSLMELLTMQYRAMKKLD